MIKERVDILRSNTARDGNRNIRNSFPHSEYLLKSWRTPRARAARRHNISKVRHCFCGVGQILRRQLILEINRGKRESFVPQVLEGVADLQWHVDIVDVLRTTFDIPHVIKPDPRRIPCFRQQIDHLQRRDAKEIQPDEVLGSHGLIHLGIHLDQRFRRNLVVDEKDAIGPLLHGNSHVLQNLASVHAVHNDKQFICTHRVSPFLKPEYGSSQIKAKPRGGGALRNICN